MPLFPIIPPPEIYEKLQENEKEKRTTYIKIKQDDKTIELLTEIRDLLKQLTQWKDQ